MRFGILKKFLFAFLTISLLPLILFAFYAQNKMAEIGRDTLENTRQALIENSTTLLEARARAIAGQIELFLNGIVDDIRALSLLGFSPHQYQEFSRSHERVIWQRMGSRDQPVEIRIKVPLYREITYVEPQGNKVIHIELDLIRDEMVDISRPFIGPYGHEDYYNQARHLQEGQFYVSRLMGRHVRKFEQLQDAPDVEHAVGGATYEGVIRFAMPVFRDKRFAGVVSVALDHRHLMEYTQHVLPFGSQEIVFPSYASGNYAFLFDDQGWIITHPKFWDIRGFDRDTGSLVDPQSTNYNETNLKAGLIPFNLLHVPFIHTNYRYLAQQVLAGNSGVTRTASVGGVERVLAFAPIRFNFGEFNSSGFFGGVTLGAQVDSFYKTVDETSAGISDIQQRAKRHFVLIILASGLIVAIIAILLARSFTRPILLLAHKVKDISKGHFDVSVGIHSGDEMEVLGRNFEEMGHQLDTHQRNLMESYQALAASKNEIESYSQRLERQVDILKTIHNVGSFLNLSFKKEQIVDVILQTCVEGLGFERALFYSYNPDSDTLECDDTNGFHEDLKSVIRETTFRIRDHRCILTRVFRDGEPVIVRDISMDETLTPLDHRLLSQIESRAFACTPVQIGNRIIGVLGADYYRLQGTIPDEAMQSLKIIANEAALTFERARLMDETVKERDFIESIFVNMLSGLIVVDHSGVIRSINPKAEKLLRLEARDVLGATVADCLTPYPPLQEFVTRAMTLQDNSHADLQLDTPPDHQIHLEVTISSIMGEPVPEALPRLLIFRDVTQRKRMERQLRRSDRLVSLGTLAAGIAHEIRNPLTGISLLLDDLHDKLGEHVDQQLLMQRALQEIEKLETLVNEMLEFAATPSSKPEAADVNQMIHQSLFFIQKQCRQQRVVLTQHNGHALPPVWVDPEKIKQALLNILLNAIKVMPDGGRIDISSRLHSRHDLFNGRKTVEIRICDTGPGIASDDIDYIFDPFFTKTPKGFGLGLSITHTIIEEHQGSVMVESTPGEGACFKIFLPAYAPHQKELAPHG